MIHVIKLNWQTGSVSLALCQNKYTEIKIFIQQIFVQL